jgi:Ni,Fe-hydrogenase III component G
MNGRIVSIHAEHDFNEEVASKVFVGPNSWNNAASWAEREIEYLFTISAAGDPDNVDIHSFRAVILDIDVEINL